MHEEMATHKLRELIFPCLLSTVDKYSGGKSIGNINLSSRSGGQVGPTKNDTGESRDRIAHFSVQHQALICPLSLKLSQKYSLALGPKGYVASIMLH